MSIDEINKLANDISEEDLKLLAGIKGFNLMKKPEKKIKLLPCKCGSKHMRVYTEYNEGCRYISIHCEKCNKLSENISAQKITLTEAEKRARLAWNKMIETEKNT